MLCCCTYNGRMDYDDDCNDDFEFDFDDEPWLDESFEIESAFASAGWGTDEDYGYYGDDW
jgi:hypothetical protein